MPSAEADQIYHIAVRSELETGIDGGFYRPASFAADGFVHCARRESVLAIAYDYYRGVAEPLCLLEIDVGRLDAELRFEAPASRAGVPLTHLDTADEFPHVYGPLNLSAIVAAAELGRADGAFVWPSRFGDLRELLSRAC